MSQENVEIVRGLSRPSTAGTVEAGPSDCDPDIEWLTRG